MKKHPKALGALRRIVRGASECADKDKAKEFMTSMKDEIKA
jgi:hypothetical protein